MKKKILLITGLSLTLFLAFFVLADDGLSITDINKKYSDCVKNCTAEKYAADKLCLSTFTNATKVAVQQNKECFASINTTNRTIARELKANCSVTLKVSRKDALDAKSTCLNLSKNNFKSCLNICKENKEIEFNFMANATANANTTCNHSADCIQYYCVGQTCRRFNCINHRCTIPRAINGWDPLQ